MEKNLKFLLLAPCLMAILCEDVDDDCNFFEPEVYTLNVENNTDVYAQNEAILLEASNICITYRWLC